MTATGRPSRTHARDVVMNAEMLATALGGKDAGKQWAACCPAHEDKSPSLIIFDGRESVQVRCLALCDPQDVIDALRARGLWGDRVSAGQASPPRSKNVSREASMDDALRSRAMALKLFDDSRPDRRNDRRGVPRRSQAVVRGRRIDCRCSLPSPGTTGERPCTCAGDRDAAALATDVPGGAARLHPAGRRQVGEGRQADDARHDERSGDEADTALRDVR